MALPTLIDLFEERVAASGDAEALRYWRDGLWRSLSWSEWLRQVHAYAAGLVALGVQKGDRVAILSRTRLEWAVADMALLMAGAIGVPIYHSNLPRQCRFLLEDSGATVVFVEDPHQLEKLLAEREALPNVRKVVYFESVATLSDPDRQGRSIVRLEDLGLSADDDWVMDFSALRELGAASVGDDPNVVLERKRTLAAEDIACIVYTSGTTGRPRGVMLSHGNVVAEIRDCAIAVPIGEQDEQLLFLPLAHAFARVVYLTAMHTGCVTIFSRGVSYLLEELQELEPTFMAGVPIVFERMHASVMSRSGSDASGARQRVAEWMLELGRKRSRLLREGKDLAPLERLQFQVADRMFFRRVRGLFGRRFRFAISGGAPLAEALCEFFHGAGVLVLEGYGLTENCAAATTNRPDAFRFGTVGTTLPSVQVRIADDGEILLRGPNIMQGYWHDPAASAEAVVDGWLHTGDIGELDGPFLRVTDRKKDIIVTSGGKNIAPLPIETRLQAIPLVDRAMVYGDRRPYLTALLTLDHQAASEWAARNGLGEASFTELAQHPRLFEAVRQSVDALNRDLSSFEQIRRFAVLDEDFGYHSGELTATFKTRRQFIVRKYRSILESFYAED